jgi:hypothetical protein
MVRLRLSIVLAVVLLCVACASETPSTTTVAETTTGPTPDTSEALTTSQVVESVGGTYVGADGVESTIKDTSRIVTLSGDLTEEVWRLGFGASVVATDVTTVYPPEAVGLPVVGVGRFLSAEGVLAQNPTLVIGDTQTSPLEAISQIRSAGVPVVLMVESSETSPRADQFHRPRPNVRTSPSSKSQQDLRYSTQSDSSREEQRHRRDENGQLRRDSERTAHITQRPERYRALASVRDPVRSQWIDATPLARVVVSR